MFLCFCPTLISYLENNIMAYTKQNFIKEYSNAHKTISKRSECKTYC